MDAYRLQELTLRELYAALLPRLESVVGGSRPAGGDLASAIGRDSLVSLALGYSGRDRVLGGPADASIKSVVLWRAVYYLQFFHWVTGVLGLTAEQLRIAGLLKHLESAQLVGRKWERLRSLVVHAFDPNYQGLELDQALLAEGRQTVDRAFDSLVWLLRPDMPDDRTVDKDLRLAVVRELEVRLSKHYLWCRDGGLDRPLREPANYLWGLLVLLEEGRDTSTLLQAEAHPVSLEEALRVLFTREEVLETTGPDPDVLFATLEITPELYGNQWRSTHLMRHDVAMVDKAVSSSQKEVKAALGDLREKLDARILKWAVEPDSELAPPPGNLHFLAQRALALCDPSVRVPEGPGDLVRDRLHIVVRDHTLFGDYVVSRDDPQRSKVEESKDLIVAQVRAYLGKGKAKRPFNIFLAAAPGAGKSFFVKNILSEIHPDAENGDSLIEANAGQFVGAADLARAMLQVTSRIAEYGRGFFFLDEVDTHLPDIGALYPRLIGPMWDGTYSFDGYGMNLKRTVWFFAGSRGDNWADFDAKERGGGAEKFSDYVSRLHLKIDLPPSSAHTRVLVFLSSLLSQCPDVRFVRRELLRVISELPAERGGNREIEKLASLVIPASAVVGVDDLPQDTSLLATKHQLGDDEVVAVSLG